MRVTILPDRRTQEMEPATVAELLRRLGLHSDAYLVVRDEEILTRDVRLRAEDAVDVIPVISGGSPHHSWGGPPGGRGGGCSSPSASPRSAPPRERGGELS